jgi:hypothetical protein
MISFGRVAVFEPLDTPERSKFPGDYWRMRRKTVILRACFDENSRAPVNLIERDDHMNR